jgi:hypothetical protein
MKVIAASWFETAQSAFLTTRVTGSGKDGDADQLR